MSIFFPIMAATVGFTIAIPFGPVNLEIIRKVLNHQTKPAIAFGLGAASADGLWPVIGFIGIAPLLEIRWVSILFWSVGTVLLAYLGINAIREHQNVHKEEKFQQKTKGKRISFMMGFTLVLSNPLNFVAWVTALGAFHTEGILPSPSLTAAFVLWGSVLIGTSSLFFLVIYLVRKYKHFISDSPIERKVNLVFGPILIGVSVYFAYNLYLILLNIK